MRRRSGDGADVRRLEALRAPRNFELHLLPLREGAESVGPNRGVVAEHVLAAVRLRDEAEALRIIEPLDRT